MNEELILKLIKNKMVNNTLTYDDFENIFNILSHEEQYAVCNILNNNGIELVDTYENFQEKKLIDEDILDDETIDFFMDASDYNYDLESCLFNDNEIQQTNEILCLLIQQGNNRAKQDLCKKNKLLIAKYANRYKGFFGSKMSVDDLMQEGYIGLLKAAERFDATLGNAFTTYATWWIKQNISRAIMDSGFMIRLPIHLMEKISKVTKLDNTYEIQGLDYKNRLIKISDALNISIREVKQVISYRNIYLNLSSLDIPIGEEEHSILIDFIKDEGAILPDDYTINELLKDELNDVLLELTDREEKVLRLRFGLDDGRTRTLEEVGKEFNVTRERIRQIEAKALRKLKHPSRSKRIKDFLEV